MLIYPAPNPIAFYLFTWPVYWYGLMYLIGFMGGWLLLVLRLRFSSLFNTQSVSCALQPIKSSSPVFVPSYDQIADSIFYTALGAIIGGRIGYMVFYDWHVLFSDPLLIFQIWKGGMSFHGGLLGVLIALWWYARQLHQPLLAVTDFIVPVVPIGLGAGRIGNFINGELWGRTTGVSWAMIFPNAGPVPRHPSQLYEAGLEGILLFVILWCYSSSPRPLGAVSGLFALGYGILRCIVECFREPDPQIGYVAFGWLTKGQLLSLPLILIGVILLGWAYYHQSQRHETVS